MSPVIDPEPSVPAIASIRCVAVTRPVRVMSSAAVIVTLFRVVTSPATVACPPAEKVASLDIVSRVDFESKEQACVRFKDLFRGQSALVNNVDCNALPASLRVKLSEPEKFAQVTAILGCETQDVDGTSKLVCAQPGIDNVVDNSRFLTRLFAVTRVFRIGVLLVSVVMLIAAAVLIANTVRMGLFARRKEIGIMKLVGATNWRIRLPFLIEGLMEKIGRAHV